MKKQATSHQNDSFSAEKLSFGTGLIKHIRNNFQLTPMMFSMQEYLPLQLHPDEFESSSHEHNFKSPNARQKRQCADGFACFEGRS
jgi:hypothetical protein